MLCVVVVVIVIMVMVVMIAVMSGECDYDGGRDECMWR